jgi:hypothetical protein
MLKSFLIFVILVTFTLMDAVTPMLFFLKSHHPVGLCPHHNQHVGTTGFSFFFPHCPLTIQSTFLKIGIYFFWGDCFFLVCLFISARFLWCSILGTVLVPLCRRQESGRRHMGRIRSFSLTREKKDGCEYVYFNNRFNDYSLIPGYIWLSSKTMWENYTVFCLSVEL